MHVRIVIVDNEKRSLNRLKNILEKSNVPGVDIVGEYTNSLEVIAQLQTMQPDVVFLDIVMPDMDGLTLGKMVRKLLPNIEIVFTSDFDKYAVNAFDLEAIDYLLKPVQKVRLNKTLQRIIKKNQPNTTMQKMIQLLGDLKVVMPNGNLQIMKWRTSKAKELFAYMLTHRNELIHRDFILKQFWPEIEKDKASNQLYTVIHTIRQTLEKYGLDGVEIFNPALNSGYKLLIEDVVIDVEQWQTQLKSLPPLEQGTIKMHEHVFQTYTGDYLGNNDYLWSGKERERLRRLWLNHAKQLSEYYIKNENYLAAVKVKEKIQSFFPDEEESYFTLMKLYDLLTNTAAVEEQYWLLKKVLKEHIEVEQSEEIERWYQNWRKKENGFAG